MKRSVQFAVIGIVLVCVVSVLIFGQVRRWQDSRKTEENDGFRVVILDSEDYFYSDNGIEQGINLALKKMQEEGKVPITVDRVDDGGNYVTGISMAKSLASDDTVDAVISFQNFESIGPEMQFFEEAQKPFIVTMGCYDEVAEKGYDYFVADFLSGKTIGERIGQYLEELSCNSIALCHSDTTFEKDEIRGIQKVLNAGGKNRVFHTQTGPFDEAELSELLVQCSKLNIDTVVANFYNQEDSAWLLSELRQRAPELNVIGDYALDSSDILKKYGDNLEGVVIVPVYPYEESSKMNDFIQNYEKETGTTFSTAAVQYYDLFCMLAEYSNQGQVTGSELMKLLKSEDGYQGIAGTIRFDETGCLHVDNCPLFVCHNQEFVRLNSK